MSAPEEKIREGWSYCGEVWTDAHGQAVVVLPALVRTHRAGFQYELVPIDTPCTARIAAEIEGDRFAVATDEPHVKVAWRLTPLREVGSETPASADLRGAAQRPEEQQ